MDSVLIGGRFRLHRLLGSGAMGQVWLATDERLERSVAVKVVIPDAADTQLGKRLEREARAAAAIQHTNVVRVFDYIEVAEGQTLIVMEYVEGETLADRIERTGQLPLEDALDIMSQICDGLTAAHRVNLVHRDLKPSNVMVTTDGVAKVLDFGIAKQTGRKESALTMTGAVIGTPRYMAPEQLTGEELSPQADVHAAGLLMYEMLAGVPAFDRENIAELMYQLLHAGPDLRPLDARGVPAEVLAILDKALQKRPENRWPSARAMADALKVSLYGDVIRARNTPSSAGLRAIIDSGERTLTRSGPGEATQSASHAAPVAVTPVPVSIPIVTAAAVTPATATSEPVVERRAPRVSEPTAAPKKSSNLPLVVVPVLVVAAVGAFVFSRMRRDDTPPASPTVASTPAGDTVTSAPATTATTP
ncbi:MAG: serine/threonine protein kinase, partial [Gemmatimonadaceae bacterium]|nr:serine/threonine protein kinase [Gemmatimonadaceae bacterium]